MSSRTPNAPIAREKSRKGRGQPAGSLLSFSAAALAAQAAVAALGSLRLYAAAGRLLLCRSGCPAVLSGTSAQLCALRAYLATYRPPPAVSVAEHTRTQRRLCDALGESLGEESASALRAMASALL